jgi:hypothetical protein
VEPEPASVPNDSSKGNSHQTLNDKEELTVLDETQVAATSPTDSASAKSAQSTDPTGNSAVAGIASPEEVAGTASPATGTDTTSPVMVTGTTSPKDLQREILRHILQYTEPVPLPAGWCELSPIETVRYLSCSPAELVAALQKYFSAAQLQAARVLDAGSEDEAQLAAVLREPRFHLVFDADRNPTDLAGDTGALFSADAPCLAYAGPWPPTCRRSKRVFVGSLENLTVLARLNLRCVSAAGLTSLDGKQARRLFAKISAEFRPRYLLTLVGWDLCDFNDKLPAPVELILERLWQIHELYGDDWNPIRVELWQPDKATIERIRLANSLCDAKKILKLIFLSLGSARSVTVARRSLHEPAVTDLVAIDAALKGAIAHPSPYGDFDDLKDAMSRMRGAMNALTTQRYLRAAAAASTPQESHVLLMKAEITQHLNYSYGPLTAKRTHGFRSEIDSGLTEERLEEIARGVNLLQKVDRLVPKTGA